MTRRRVLPMTTYRVTMTDTTGAETVQDGLTQDEVDTLIDLHESRGSLVPVGVVERQKADGSWVPNGGWDIRPRVAAPPTRRDYSADVAAEMAAVARIN